MTQEEFQALSKTENVSRINFDGKEMLIEFENGANVYVCMYSSWDMDPEWVFETAEERIRHEEAMERHRIEYPLGSTKIRYEKKY